jgi:hypothetical protein
MVEHLSLEEARDFSEALLASPFLPFERLLLCCRTTLLLNDAVIE